jgi:phospholipid transport system substrate-binding protein
MKHKTLVVFILSALSLVFIYTPCGAGAPTERVRNMLDQVMSIQTDPQFKSHEFRNQRRIAIKKIIAKNFDFDAMAKQALGQFWQCLDVAQRTGFKSLFQDLFQDSYTRLVLNFLKREEIFYANEQINYDHTLIKTTIIRTNDEIPVDYFLALVDKDWLVHDVEIDGVSIVRNYQEKFARVIKTESYEALLNKMRLQQKTIEKDS